MTTLSDITSEVNSQIDTNTTGDVTAARVRTVIIDAVTRILSDLSTGDAATLAAALAGSATIDGDTTQLLAFGNTINLFDKSKVTANTFLFNNGTTTGAGGTAISDYIPISALKPIIANHSEIFGGFTAHGVVFYDVNKTFISGTSFFDGTNPITAPAGAFYFRTNVLDSIRDDL